MNIDHEIFNMPEYTLPIKITYRESNSNSQGCYYHWHEQLEIYYIISGGIDLLCNGANKWIYEGEIAVINWCEPHRSLNFLDGTSHFIIQVDTDSLLFQTFKNINNFPNFIEKNEVLNELLNSIIEEYNQKKKGHELVIIGNVMCVLGNLCRLDHIIKTNDNQQLNFIHIKRILTYVHDGFVNDIHLGDIAKELEISKSHMCRLFKKHTGITINNYINKLRCNLAISLITNGHSITKTSTMVGFNDYNYFSRLFKKAMGYSPSCIKNSRNKNEKSPDRFEAR